MPVGLFDPTLRAAALFDVTGAARFGWFDGDFITVTGSSDTTAPISTLVSETRTVISAASGRNSTDITWSVDEAATAWEFRLVPGTASPHTAGTLIVGGGSVPANAEQVTTITQAQVVAAGGAEGGSIIKLFASDAAGNWSV